MDRWIKSKKQSVQVTLTLSIRFDKVLMICYNIPNAIRVIPRELLPSTAARIRSYCGKWTVSTIREVSLELKTGPIVGQRNCLYGRAAPYADEGNVAFNLIFYDLNNLLINAIAVVGGRAIGKTKISNNITMKSEWCPPKLFSEFPPFFQLYPCAKDSNPGSIQQFHYLAGRLKPQFIDGLMMDYSHRLSPNKILTTNWVLSHNQPAGFRFGGIYAYGMCDNVLETPVIHADINPSTMSTNVGILYFPVPWLRFEGDLRRAADELPLHATGSVEYRGDLSTITLNLYNVSTEFGRATVSFLRSVSHHIALGGELLLEWADPTSVMADTAFAARYMESDFSMAATASRQGVDVSFWQRLHPKIQMSTTWAWQRKTQKSVGTVCYKWDFDNAYVKGMFDSNLSVGFMYASALSHLPVSAAMSLLINLHTNRFMFGLKFMLDPSGLQKEN
ncbi:hypothetical protein GQX74_000198 [Glossina fuscipes]|nr:hypothetical protein GQX74_000198 [Glossina fuscipes]